MNERLLLTPAEYARHLRELDDLRRRRDRDVPQRLRDARTYVASDAIEEIAQIEDDDVVVRVRIARLQELLDEATIVDDGHAEDVVTLGRAVEVRYLRTGRTRTYVLAGSVTEGGAPIVSARSPVGQALMGRSSGDVVSVQLPDGRVEELRLMSVEDGPAELPAA